MEVTPSPLPLRPEASVHSKEIRILTKTLVNCGLTADGLVLQNLPGASSCCRVSRPTASPGLRYQVKVTSCPTLNSKGKFVKLRAAGEVRESEARMAKVEAKNVTILKYCKYF
jgi:hypothetical protein